MPENYVFDGTGADGMATTVKLSELFAPSEDSLVIYSFMFPRDVGIDNRLRRTARSPGREPDQRQARYCGPV